MAKELTPAQNQEIIEAKVKEVYSLLTGLTVFQAKCVLKKVKGEIRQSSNCSILPAQSQS